MPDDERDAAVGQPRRLPRKAGDARALQFVIPSEVEESLDSFGTSEFSRRRRERLQSYYATNGENHEPMPR
jgi:hypothetical protein